jgi:hypothetical protein
VLDQQRQRQRPWSGAGCCAVPRATTARCWWRPSTAARCCFRHPQPRHCARGCKLPVAQQRRPAAALQQLRPRQSTRALCLPTAKWRAAQPVLCRWMWTRPPVQRQRRPHRAQPQQQRLQRLILLHRRQRWLLDRMRRQALKQAPPERGCTPGRGGRGWTMRGACGRSCGPCSRGRSRRWSLAPQVRIFWRPAGSSAVATWLGSDVRVLLMCCWLQLARASTAGVTAAALAQRMELHMSPYSMRLLLGSLVDLGRVTVRREEVPPPLPPFYKGPPPMPQVCASRAAPTRLSDGERLPNWLTGARLCR